MKWIYAVPLMLAVAVAQGPPYGPGPRGPQMHHGGDRIRMMKMWKLTELLELTEDQAEVFFPRHNSLTDELHAMNEKQNDLLKQVDAMLEGDKKIDDRDLSRILKEITEIEKEKLEKRREFFDGLGDILTPVQKAQYMVFEGRFKHMLWKHVRKSAGMESEEPDPKMKLRMKRRP